MSGSKRTENDRTARISDRQQPQQKLEDSGHIPVLLDEVCEFFETAPQAGSPRFVLDCTLGNAGHAQALLSSGAEVSLAGIDQDRTAVERAAKRLAEFKERVCLMQANFREISHVAQRTSFVGQRNEAAEGVQPLRFDYVLADLGVSSIQLADPSRGLSFDVDAPLDMRLNLEDSTATAADILNSYSELQLKAVFARGGMRKYTGQLVRKIVDSRPVLRTGQFANICEQVIPRYSREKKIGAAKHPATIPFQAIRIEVNHEFEALKALLDSAPQLLAEGGRLAIISFHSLEDRLVAQSMRSWSRSAIPNKLPLRSTELCQQQPAIGEAGKGLLSTGTLLTKKAVVPTDEELQRNPRARSARLRVFEKHQPTSSIRNSNDVA